MPDNNNSKREVTMGLVWSFGERITAQLVSTLVAIILARILSPEHYGAISLVTVFISLSNVFVTSGFGSAIVQKKEADFKDYDTAFWLSFGISAILYVILFFTAAYIAAFYQMPELKWVIRVMAIRLPIASINTVQQARMRRQMAFKKFFLATLLGTVVSGVVGITLAIYDFGIWALVAQYLTNSCIDTLVLCFVSGWMPHLNFSLRRAKTIFSFGWKVFATDFVSTLESDIRSLIVGKVFGTADLAFYDQGKKYPSLIITNINASINKVMLPAYSRCQDNFPELKKMLRRSIQLGIYIFCPILVGFSAVADVFVKLVLTEKWMPCVPYIRVFCVIFLLRPLEASCHQAILAIGKSNVVLRIMILINATALSTVLIASFVFKSVILIAYGSLLSTIVSVTAFLWETRKSISYQFCEQIHDVLNSVLISILMGIVVNFVGQVNLPNTLLLFMQIVIGTITYLLASYVFQNEAFTYLLGNLKQLKRRKASF